MGFTKIDEFLQNVTKRLRNLTNWLRWRAKKMLYLLINMKSTPRRREPRANRLHIPTVF